MAALFAGGAVTLIALGVIVASARSGDDDALRAAALVALAVWTLTLGGIAYWVLRGSQEALRAVQLNDPARLLIEFGDEVAQGLFERQEMDALLKRLAESLVRRFDRIYHVQVYLTPPGSAQAVLRAATGAAGDQLLAQEHALDVGGLSVIGRVTRTGNHVLIPDYNRETIHKPDALLPQTRSELAIPLAASGSVIGALDAQSLEPDAFSPSDIDLLRAIANQLAMAIDSLHLYEQSQRSIRENQALYQQTQANLREIERLNYQLTGRAWSDYLRLQGESAAITLDLDSGQATHDAEWTATLDEAATQRQALTVTQAGQRVVALPIVVRNEVVGAMEFELASEAALPDGVMDLVAAVGQRLGLALENRRLFDESQRAVQREALINDIGADLQAATGVEAIIQRAARHLREALAAQEVLIRLGAPPDQDNDQQTARKAQR
jgi:GAF domain-containing protein